jgi:hypothetical protein
MDRKGSIIRSRKPNLKTLLLLTIFLLSSFTIVSGSAAQFVHKVDPSLSKDIPSLLSASAQSPPSGVVAYVPITIFNNDYSDEAVAPFQQLISIDFDTYSTYLNSVAENIQFYDSSWNPIYAWIESGAFCPTCSSSQIWVRLDQNIQPQESITIYLAFFSNSVDNYNANGYVGTSPDATQSYGYFNNGKSVFDYYQAWGGLSALPSNWSCAKDGSTCETTESFGSTYTTLSISGTSGGWYGVSGTTSSLGISSSWYYYAVDMRGDMYTGVNAGNAFGFTDGNNPQNNADCGNYVTFGIQNPGSSDADDYGTICGQYKSSSFSDSNSMVVYSSTMIPGDTGTPVDLCAQVNYGSCYDTGFYQGSSAPSYTYLGIFNSYNAGCPCASGSVKADWIRVRESPPGGTMPSATFGQIVTISNYYGMNSCSSSGCPITLSCYQPSSDSIYSSGYANTYDSCVLGGAAVFGYSNFAGFVKAEALLESGLQAVVYSTHDGFPGPCGYSGYDPLDNYQTIDASHSYGLFQETPTCGQYFAYTPSQAGKLGYTSCVGTGSNMQSIPSAKYFYCAPEGNSSDPSQYIAGWYADVATDNSLAIYGYSAYNPAFNTWIYWNTIYGMFSSTINAGQNYGDGNLNICTVNQQWYIVIAAYNEGSEVYSQLHDANGQGAKCVLESGTRGYNYVNSILNDYSNLFGSRGPYAQFPNY